MGARVMTRADREGRRGRPPKAHAHAAAAERKAMIDRGHRLALSRQAELLGISRGSLYHDPCPVSVIDLAIMRRIDELHLDPTE